LAGLRIRLEEIVRRMDLVDMLPPASIERLHPRGKADVVEDPFPIERELHVAHRLRCRSSRMFLRWQQNRLRHCDAELRSERIVEELIIRRPPEWIVDDTRSVQCRVLEHRAIERDVVRDAVDE